MYMHDLTTGTRKAQFPLEVGSVSSLTGRKEDTNIFYTFTSFLSPSRIYTCDLTKEVIAPTVCLNYILYVNNIIIVEGITPNHESFEVSIRLVLIILTATCYYEGATCCLCINREVYMKGWEI